MIKKIAVLAIAVALVVLPLTGFTQEEHSWCPPTRHFMNIFVYGNAWIANKLAIGTTSPEYKLDVVGDYGEGARLSFGGDFNYVFTGNFASMQSEETITLNSSSIYLKCADGDALSIIESFGNGNVGIRTTNPERPLHISDVMRLEPRVSEPADPSEGDLYVNAVDQHLYCYLGGAWKQLDN